MTTTRALPRAQDLPAARARAAADLHVRPSGHKILKKCPSLARLIICLTKCQKNLKKIFACTFDQFRIGHKFFINKH
jgi:hypothetical protein